MLSMHTSPLAALGGKETGGMNVYVRELCRVLSARGWRIDIFTRWQDPEAPRVQRVWQDCCRVIHIPAGPVGPLDRRTLFPLLPEFVAGIRAFVEEDFGPDQDRPYDLIHTHYWLSGWAAVELRRWWDVPIVHMFHTLGRMKDSVAEAAGQDKPATTEADNRAAVEQQVMEAVDRIIAATPLDRQQMIDLYDADPQKIVVIPCGVDLDLFRPIDPTLARRELGLENGRRLLLFVGRLDPVKGLDVLLEAMCELTRRMQPCRAQDLSLAVIGGDRESHLEALTTDLDCLAEIRVELGLDDLVIFIGSIDQQRLPYYYSAAEACVMPSLYESFGMVALEAMACGTPVIASRVGGLQYTVRDGETGFLVPEKNPKALAEKLELVLCDEALRQRLASQAIRVAAEYSWAAVADAIEGLYTELGLGMPARCQV
jgi:D-inositol-3-phosphate glycosyltransferase